MVEARPAMSDLPTCRSAVTGVRPGFRTRTTRPAYAVKSWEVEVVVGNLAWLWLCFSSGLRNGVQVAASFHAGSV